MRFKLFVGLPVEDDFQKLSVKAGQKDSGGVKQAKRR